MNGTVVADNGTLLRGAPYFFDHWKVPGIQSNTQYYKDYLRDAVEKYHMNVIRFSPWIGNWENMIVGSQDYEQHRDRFTWVADNVVDWCEEFGVYAIIDLHCQYNTYADLQKHKDFWNWFAPRYKDRTNVFYEATNEPHIASITQNMAAIYQHIRALAPETHIVCFSLNDPTKMSVDVITGITGIDYSNASFGFHVYDGIAGKTALWDATQVIQSRGIPIVCTEFYSQTNMDNSPIDYHYLMSNIRIAENRQISWIQWSPDGYPNSGREFSDTYLHKLAEYGIPHWPLDNNPSAIEPPVAPDGLSANANSSTTITLCWTDKSDNEAGFELERAENTGPFTKIATLLVNTTLFIDDGLAPVTEYRYRVRAFNGAGPSDWSGEAATETSEAAEGEVVAAINCGGDAFVGADGITYVPDRNYTGGQTYMSVVGITGTDDNELFHSERYGTDFHYDIPVSNGAWEVTLRFAENFITTAGGRIFSVTAEGNPIASNIDLYAMAGPSTAYDITELVTVEDGGVTLSFTSSVENANICAIVVSRPSLITGTARPEYRHSPTAASHTFTILYDMNGRILQSRNDTPERHAASNGVVIMRSDGGETRRLVRIQQ